MTATRIFYRVTDGQPVTLRADVVVRIEGAKAGTTAAVNDRTDVVWTQDDRPITQGDLAGVQFELELPAPIDDKQLTLFTDEDYR
jgi:hypothetical protein